MSERHAFRAKWHDYNGGIYFGTICSYDKKHIFGKIDTVGTRLIASAEKLPSSSQGFGCIKPPRHGVAVIDNHHNSKLASIIGTFKAGVTRTARTRLIASLPCWQSRYHEHIVRNQRAYDNIMEYIDNNIVNWNTDCFYRNGTK